MEEVIERHRMAGLPLPPYLYTDWGCCDGKPMCFIATLDIVKPIEATDSDDATSPEFGSTVWKSKFTVHSDGMHLIMCIIRQLPGNHPRRPSFLRDLDVSIY